MSDEENETKPLTVLIPTITTDGVYTTSGQIVINIPGKEDDEQVIMETSEAPQNLRKRRNLSKNRAQATRQREKTPEPGRMGVPHEDTTTSDEDEARTKRLPHSAQEAEAEDNYKEMMRLVQERSDAKDPDDLDIDEIKEARAFAANERRRRSISPFAVPTKEELASLQRKGSFVDPGNKLLSTTYTLSHKEEEKDGRRDSLTIDTAPLRRSSLSPSTPTSSSPREGAVFPYPSPPKQQTELIYPDEKKQEPGRKVLTPVKKDDGDVFTFDEEEKKTSRPPSKTVPQEQPTGGLVTKVIQVERSPSRKLAQENKPVVEVRPTTPAATVERTPSKKSLSESRPMVVRRSSAKPATKDQQQQTQEPTRLPPPVKPARSKSASRLGGKTSESEMSEDQLKLTRESAVIAAKRKTIATPRRFVKNKSPRAKRSQSVTRVEDLLDKTGTGMSQTSREIIQLLQQARARSLSIPNDDERIPVEYKNDKRRTLTTPNKSPSSRRTRGISCPKTIQIISQKEVLAGLSKVQKLDLEFEKNRTSRYIDASQSEYTSSCYSTSPSENEYEFNLVSKTAELNKKLAHLSQELEKRDKHLHNGEAQLELSKSALRKRYSANVKKDSNKEKPKASEERKPRNPEDMKVEEKEVQTSKYRILNLRREWRGFKTEHKKDYDSIKLLNNKCLCDLMILIIFCGIGGMVFKNLEGSFESAYKCGTRNVKRDFIENLWKGSHYLREDDWKAMARNKLHEFEDQLHTAHEAGMTSHSRLRSWNFMNSFVYCLTIVTTIGYGHIVPSTTSGRIATIFYAIIGIPLFLIVLADFGKLFTRIIKFFWSFIRRLYYTGSCRKVRNTAPMQEMMKGFNMVYDVVRRPSQMLFEEDLSAVRRPSQQDRDDIAIAIPKREDTIQSPPPLPPKPGQQPTWIIGGDAEVAAPPETPAPSVFEIDDEFNLPISLAIIILIGYIFIGATLYMAWEDWTFTESFYFVFISMSTIGFGDYVPGHPMYMMASILYLVFGLALTSMCINVVQVKLSDTFKHASAKLGATIGLRVAEEDGALVPMTPALGDVAPVHRPLNKDRDEVTDTGLRADDVDPEISSAMS